jgi:hypothetical protein
LKSEGKELAMPWFLPSDKSGIPALRRETLWRYFAQPVAIPRPDQVKNEVLVNFPTGSHVPELFLSPDSTAVTFWIGLKQVGWIGLAGSDWLDRTGAAGYGWVGS